MVNMYLLYFQRLNLRLSQQTNNSDNAYFPMCDEFCVFPNIFDEILILNIKRNRKRKVDYIK